MTFGTERLSMLRWKPGQEQAWFAIFGDAAVTQFTFGAPDPDLEASRRGIGHIIRRSERDVPLGWWAIVDKTSQEIIGTIGLNKLPDGKTAELGYHFRRDAWSTLR